MFEILDLDIDKIIIDDRARKLGDDLDVSDLEYSIEEHGLINPITVDENYRLLAGGRRLKAHMNLGKDKILARVMPGLRPEDHYIIELVENTLRRDFTWVEELSLKGKIHKYFCDSEGEDWSLTATADRMGVSKATLSTDLQILSAVETFPQLTTYQTKGKAREAFKKLVRHASATKAMRSLSEEDQKELESMLASHHDASEVPDTTGVHPPKKATPSTDLPSFAYKDCDVVELLTELPDNSIGLVELDPPYAINFDKVYGATQNIKTTLQDWEADEFVKKMSEIAAILPQKLIKDSFVLVWTAIEWVDFLQKTFAENGFSIQKPGIWVKPGGSSNTPATNLISNYETYLLFRFGDARFRTGSLPGAFVSSGVLGKDKMHPTEKPVNGVYDHLFKAIARPKTLFVSGFAGSGNAMIAAALAGMKPFGTDINKNRYYSSFHANLRAAFNQGDTNE